MQTEDTLLSPALTCGGGEQEALHKEAALSSESWSLQSLCPGGETRGPLMTRKVTFPSLNHTVPHLTHISALESGERSQEP